MKVLLLIMLSCPDGWTYFKVHSSSPSHAEEVKEDFRTSKDFEKCVKIVETF